uniref:Protein kinase domain-containing protein n=1 Tax=Rhabditophanes sp. KR3021 TaxID=114890 RepID=A0AC35TG35_9BILA
MYFKKLDCDDLYVVKTSSGTSIKLANFSEIAITEDKQFPESILDAHTLYGYFTDYRTTRTKFDTKFLGLIMFSMLSGSPLKSTDSYLPETAFYTLKRDAAYLVKSMLEIRDDDKYDLCRSIRDSLYVTAKLTMQLKECLDGERKGMEEHKDCSKSFTNIKTEAHTNNGRTTRIKASKTKSGTSNNRRKKRCGSVGSVNSRLIESKTKIRGSRKISGESSLPYLESALVHKPRPNKTVLSVSNLMEEHSNLSDYHEVPGQQFGTARRAALTKNDKEFKMTFDLAIQPRQGKGKLPFKIACNFRDGKKPEVVINGHSFRKD